MRGALQATWVARVPARVLARVLVPTLALTAVSCGGGSGSSDATSGGPSTAVGAGTLAVLIAQGDATSEAIGLAYQKARGIPDSHVIRLAVPAGNDVIGDAAFTALKAALDARLTPEVQATLVTWMQPSRVQGSCTMSLTSALTFGYSAAWCGGCKATQASGYFNHATRTPFTTLGIRPSMMLGAATLAEAQALVARGVAADASLAGGAAAGQGWLLRTSDPTRSVRYSDFLQLAAASTTGITWHYVDNASASGSDIVAGQSDVMFYFTGLQSVPQINTNTYRPGAVADALTSFGGVLPSGNGQMPATAWLQAGATASYGTVEEPCNFTEKFPQASVLVNHYQRGKTLIEAYWKSVQWPGEGLFLGEPLAHPWAR